MDFYKIFNKVIVYPNVINNCNDLQTKIQTLNEESFEGVLFNNWRDWYDLGRICDADGEPLSSELNYTNKIKHYSKNKKWLLDIEYDVFKTLREATQTCINHYVSLWDIAIPNPWYITNPNLAVYQPGVDSDGFNHVMPFHTDYGVGEWFWPGEKFLLTCTTYVNDDYLGGEILFYVDGQIISYKPTAGDVLVFPSGNPLFSGNHPHFHGVNKIENGYKTLIRTYLKYFSSTNLDLWIACERLYGKDRWKDMAQKYARGKNILPWSAIELSLIENRQIQYSDLITLLYQLPQSTLPSM